MGDPCEPGSPSREVVRAALLSGLGTANCNCGTNDDVIHDPRCPIAVARDRAMKELAKQDSE